jgi:SNF2 family DNA or RNA helicase
VLRLKHDQLRWQQHDVPRMARAIGADFAEQLRAPLDAGTARAAVKTKVQIHKSVAQYIDAQKALRTLLKAQQKMADAPGVPELFPEQRSDLQYLKDTPLGSYLLAHDPGVGKTAVAIRWVSDLLRATKVLVICPNSAKEQWAGEIRKWDPRFPDIAILKGTIEEQSAQIRQFKHGWMIAHWESLVHARPAFLKQHWPVVIPDEIHLVANHKTQRAKTLFDLDKVYSMALTAHPYARHPGELWAILHFLYKKQYSSYWRFYYTYVEWFMDRFGAMNAIGAKRPKLLRWSILPFTLRRTKASLGIRPPTRPRRTVALPAAYRKEYDRLRKEMFVEIEGREKKLPIIEAMTRAVRIRQWLIDPGLIGGALQSLKYPILHELLQDLPVPPVIFTHFRQAIGRASTWLRRQDRTYTFGVLQGGMTGQGRQQVITKFLDGNISALFVVAQAGGLSLNLGGHGYGIFLDLPWTARDYEQIEGRVDRPSARTGKRIPTTMYRVIVHNTFEDRIMEPLLASRYDEFGKVFHDKLTQVLFK